MKTLRRCDSCTAAHRACIRCLGETTCERCAKTGNACTITTKPRKKYERSGTRIELAKKMFEKPRLDGRAEKAFKAPVEANLLSTSYENNRLRKTQMAGSLTIALMQDGARSAFSLFPPRDGGYSAINSFIQHLVQSFDAAGMDSGSELMGDFGQIRVALYIAIGAMFSQHSAIVGASKVIGSSGAPSSSERDEDFREFGLARWTPMNALWKRCASLCRESHLSQSSTFDALAVMLQLSVFVPYGSDDADMFYSWLLNAFPRIPVGATGWVSDEQKTTVFSLLTANDPHIALERNRMPLLSDEMIHHYLNRPDLDGNTFLLFTEGKHVPTAKNRDHHIEILRATNLACERLCAVAAAAMKDLNSSKADDALNRAAAVVFARQSWRKKTYHDDPDTGVRICCSAVDSQSFGEEPLQASFFDLEQTLRCFASLSGMVFGQLKIELTTQETYLYNRERAAHLMEMGKSCLSEVNNLITEIYERWLDLAEAEWNRPQVLQAFVSSFMYLPAGVRYLAAYLYSSSNQKVYFSRTNQIIRTWAGLKRLAFRSGRWLDCLEDLESSLHELHLLQLDKSIKSWDSRPSLSPTRFLSSYPSPDSCDGPNGVPQWFSDLSVVLP